MAKLKVVESDENPLCPYCENELTEVHVNTRQRSWSLGEKPAICFCPHCRRVLGISFSKAGH